MSMRWSIAPHDRSIVARITREMRCSPLLAQVLAARGCTSGEDARRFLSVDINDLVDPNLLPGAGDAADRIAAAIKAKRRITIYGDYDVDGVTATSILWHCLKLSGGRVDYYIPCRMEEGYGLNADAVRQLHAEDPDRLLITVDCGVASLEEARLAAQLGLEMIVTDHHTFAESLPEAACLVHPRLPESRYPFGDLCGAGVAFKLAWAVCQRLGDGERASPAMREFLKSAVGLAALGTVADVVPLKGENRIIVRYGLGALREMPIAGMPMLLDAAGLRDKPELTAEDIGFGLAPRINAAGRLGQARLAVELLTTDNRERASQLADYVDQLNKNRQTVERKIFRQAKDLVEEHESWGEDAALVLAHDEWHPGVIGIVAGRIAEHFGRPAVMIAFNKQQEIGQGSGRSYNGFDLHRAVSACQEHLEGFGGHQAAVGLRIRSEAVEAFRRSLAEVAGEPECGPSHEPSLHVDAEVQLADLTHRAVKELEQLGPFGCEHERPTFVTSGVQLAEPARRMGGGDRHLSIRVRQGDKVLRCVAFGKGDWAEELDRAGDGLSICFSPGLNHFNGYASVELRLHAWSPAEQPASSR
ncbi:MAG: single-stranded-DNA-specific exonuclease RecJ [Planctomycetota bacterium]|nr:MAG: single-stranded-DNA-specific exonuclease RecJ [Planctomycetota bacterium]